MKNSTPHKKTRTNGAWQCGSGGVAVWQWGRGSVAVGAWQCGTPPLPHCHAPAAHAPTATLQHSTATPRCHTPTATQPRSTATLHCHAPATLPRPNYHTATLHCHASLPHCHAPTATLTRPTATLRWFFGFGCCVVFGVDFLILNFCVFVLVLIFLKFSALLRIQKKGKTTNKKQMRKR